MMAPVQPPTTAVQLRFSKSNLAPNLQLSRKVPPEGEGKDLLILGGRLQQQWQEGLQEWVVEGRTERRPMGEMEGLVKLFPNCPS